MRARGHHNPHIASRESYLEGGTQIQGKFSTSQLGIRDRAPSGLSPPDLLGALERAGTARRALLAGYRRAKPACRRGADISLTGTKFRVADIEPEVLGIADIVIDHGLRKYHLYRASSTLLDLKTMAVVLYGACFELIADILARHFDIALPPPPPGHILDLVGDRL